MRPEDLQQDFEGRPRFGFERDVQIVGYNVGAVDELYATLAKLFDDAAYLSPGVSRILPVRWRTERQQAQRSDNAATQRVTEFR